MVWAALVPELQAASGRRGLRACPCEEGPLNKEKGTLRNIGPLKEGVFRWSSEG